MADASREAWTHQYQPRPNAVNQSVSYYVKGAVVAFVLDARLRADSRGRRSLDDVVQLLWRQWGDTPYPEEAIYAAVAEIGDEDVAAWLRPLVDDVVEPDVLLAPLLGFDQFGGRLGYGGGFYDRTIAKLRAKKPVTAIGLAFEIQRVEEVPLGPYDERLDWIVTEAAAYKTVRE